MDTIRSALDYTEVLYYFICMMFSCRSFMSRSLLGLSIKKVQKGSQYPGIREIKHQPSLKMALTETSTHNEPKTKEVNGVNGVRKIDHGAGALANGTANPHTANRTKKYGSSTDAPRRIAICGMAMRLPGGIRNSDSLWDVLLHRRDTRGPIPSERYNSDGFSDRMSAKGAIKTQHGYFLDEDLACLDTSFFTMTRNELERMDPQQRQLLEVTRECLENAGEVDYRGKVVGCYVGTFGEDWLQMSAKEPQHSGGYIMTGHGDLMIANRVSFEYDFRGPR